jgi:phosphoserine phosphatase
VQIHPGLADIDYGDWQGLSPDEARQRWPEQIDKWYNHPEQTCIPNGESLADPHHRAMQTVHELTGKHHDDTIVLVGRTVINRIILLAVLGLGNKRFWKIKQDTCAINVFEAKAGDFILVFFKRYQSSQCLIRTISPYGEPAKNLAAQSAAWCRICSNI